jgi:hypothetical protein
MIRIKKFLVKLIILGTVGFFIKTSLIYMFDYNIFTIENIISLPSLAYFFLMGLFTKILNVILDASLIKEKLIIILKFIKKNTFNSKTLIMIFQMAMIGLAAKTLAIYAINSDIFKDILYYIFTLTSKIFTKDLGDIFISLFLFIIPSLSFSMLPIDRLA